VIGDVFDLEANGLNPDRIHCVSVNGKGTTADYDKMKAFFEKATVLVGHNIQRYDVPVVEKIVGVKVKAMLIDTLALSWYLYPERIRHGLEEWGVEFGIPKPVVDDWENLTQEEYFHRCEQDVRINSKLWEKMWKDLVNLYETEEEAIKFLKYLEFKMDCAREQEKYGWKLDVKFCQEKKAELEILKDEKMQALVKAMPKKKEWAEKLKPKKMYKITGELSKAGEEWNSLLDASGMDINHPGPVKYLKSEEDGNPDSHVQLKEWLDSLGWKPTTFKYKREDDGTTRQIPQIQKDKSVGEGLCDSVLKLIPKAPALEILQGLSILTHRISVLKGFLENVDEDGYVQAKIAGLTNTLRFKHAVVVNLPGVDKPYGGDIRGCLVASEGNVLAGSDMSSLEDRTGRHYMFKYDPEYVNEMSDPKFDPHLDLACSAGYVSMEQVEEYVCGNKTKLTTAIRKTFKTVNYACKYGAQGKKIALTLGIAEQEGYKLVDAYWKRNWSVKAVADACEVKVCNGRMWLYNPVSKFWYSLRHNKDRFSTLNQGTGVFCFDTYLKHIRQGGPPVIGQMHDEFIAQVKLGNEERFRQHVNEAIRKVNEELGLDVQLDVGLDFGHSYAEIH
jgi:DNA polymerase III epsilon subunit-like protein